MSSIKKAILPGSLLITVTTPTAINPESVNIIIENSPALNDLKKRKETSRIFFFIYVDDRFFIM